MPHLRSVASAAFLALISGFACAQWVGPAAPDSRMKFETGPVYVGVTSLTSARFGVIEPATSSRVISSYAFAGTPTNGARTTALWGETNNPKGRALQGFNFSAADSGDTNNPATGVWAETASPTGNCIRARATASSGSAIAGYFEAFATNAISVYAVGENPIYADTAGENSVAIRARSLSSSGSPTSLRSTNSSQNGIGVYSSVDSGSGTPIALYAISPKNGYAGYFFGGKTYLDGKIGIGNYLPNYKLEVRDSSSDATVYAVNSSASTGANTGGPAAVKGLISSTSAGAYSSGVWGLNNSTNINGSGIAGYHAGSGVGVFGAVQASSNGAAVLGTVIGSGTTASAGSFLGNVFVLGNVSKGGGSFKIDHPLDPENKYLYHSFVESPDMMNVYNGNVVTDDQGFATITLPDWFETLNRDFRYQLSVIDESAPDMHFVRVSRKIKDNTFVIKSVPGNMEISWQVTGIRHDKYAQKHRIPTEELKADKDRGKYLHPDVYGLPLDRGIYHHDLTGINADLAAKAKHQEGVPASNARIAAEIAARAARAHAHVGNTGSLGAQTTQPLTPAIAAGR
ncbi:MAG: hypothetical protein KGS45_05160 [Planctomycetes bacterium]|nr:hypothetical protein [Planctomycetota bacterium]